jgi:hypothetical protein
MAISRLRAASRAEHERSSPREDFLLTFSAMSEKESGPSKLAAALAASLKEQALANVLISRTRLLKRREDVLAALPP